MAAKKKATRKKAPIENVQMGSDQRKYARHANLILCRYLVDQCWISGYNEVVLSDDCLRKYYNLQVLRDVRLDWLRNDAAPWFVGPFREDLHQIYRSSNPSDVTPEKNFFAFFRVGSALSGKTLCNIQVLPSIEKMERYLAEVSLGWKRPTRAKGLRELIPDS